MKSRDGQSEMLSRSKQPLVARPEFDIGLHLDSGQQMTVDPADATTGQAVRLDELQDFPGLGVARFRQGVKDPQRQGSPTQIAQRKFTQDEIVHQNAAPVEFALQRR